MNKYYELIIYLLDCHQDGVLDKEILRGIPADDIQAAKEWSYQKMQKSMKPATQGSPIPDRIRNDFKNWEWSEN